MRRPCSPPTRRAATSSARISASRATATPARRLLLQALFGSQEHRNAEELAAEVRSHAPDVHMSTVYRNLEELARLGIIDCTRMGKGPATYHLASAAHGHLVCEKCGSMTEVPDDMFRALVRSARTKYGFAINPHRFAVTASARTASKPSVIAPRQWTGPACPGGH